jgi:hypothetical protein
MEEDVGELVNEAGLEVEEIEEGLVVRGRCRGPLWRGNPAR